MKTVQFNANSILNGNNYPIAYYYPMAKDLVVISTGHDDSIIDDSLGYSEYIIPILEAILKTSIKEYELYLASITSTVTDIEYIQAALYNVFCENNETCEPIVNYANNTFIITDIYSC